ncbi:MAG TPA: shikimate kinase [Bacillota bacterium]|nr:shikimate kinase [Bacillota bacterium]HPT88087.1 shikimate kinase [Bacillota bacterium]
MREVQNIVLIGMPGAGKSTVGVLLAKSLGMAFDDTDLLIQQQDGRLLQAIINEEGVQRFLEIEADVVSSLQRKDTVIATGGSVVYSDRAMHHLKENGLVIYLRIGFEELEKRLTNMATRGIAIGSHQSLYSLYCERIPLYEKYADIIIDSSSQSVEETLKRILEALDKRG